MSAELSAPLGLSWSDANQRVLVAEFGRLKALLAGEDTSAACEAIEEARAELPSPAAIDLLSEWFGLTAFERDVLLLCAGVELDGALAARQPFATFGLALATFAEPHWSALAPIRPLRLWRLVDVHDERTPTRSRLSIDERVLQYLGGVNYLDPRLRALMRPHMPPSEMAAGHLRTADSMTQALQRESAAPIVQLVGDDPVGQRDVAATVGARLALQLHALRAADIPPNAHEAEALSLLWQREGTVLRSALLIEQGDADTNTIERFVEQLGGLIFVAARQTLPIPGMRFAIDRPSPAEQKRLWIQALGPAADTLNGAVDGVAAQFRFSAGTIARTGERLRAALISSETPDALLWRECRASVPNRLDDLAQRVQPVATWNDLILPDTQVATLRQVAVHVRQRHYVYEHWGFASTSARGLGIGVLFSGESGTGKTMAAEVLANELCLDLYRIDLAATVSKYIGETEKNLRRVFDAAEDSGAILLFDEADALFGKRSEVRDSHDRYANIEVSYLLQRMEAYRGLAILTTNASAAVDPAFLRRLRFVVQFPFPDQPQRERIWRGVFPQDTPLDGLDFAKLARLNVTGGAIRNIALNAAFLAADAGRSVTMGHLFQSARVEAVKRDRPFSDAETRGWA